MQIELLIENCTVITMDPNRRVIERGAVGINGNEIAVVDSLSELDGVEAAKTIDGTNMVALPGLVDAHAHAGHGLTKTLGEGGLEQSWGELMEHIYYRCSTEEFWYAEAKLTGLERLLFGVTTGVSMLGSAPRYDDLRYARAHVEGMRELGVRDILGIGPPNPPFPKTFRHWEGGEPGDSQELGLAAALQTTREAVGEFNDTQGGLTYCYPSPSKIGRAEELSHEDHLKTATVLKELAEEFDTPIHGHSYAGDIKYAYEELDLLGPRVFTAHVTGISQQEIEYLADSGAWVCSGPSTTAYIRSRCPVVELLEAGANVVFCTDASAPDRTYDLFEKLRFGLRLHRSHFNDPQVLPAGKALEMVTIDAARAVGLADSIGSIETGKKADIILVDMEKPHLYPLWMEPVRMVYEVSGQDVDTVIVDGRVLVKGGEAVHTEVGRVLKDAQAEAEKAVQRAGAQQAVELPERFWGHVRY